MSEPSFPKQEHKDYLLQRVKRQLGKRVGLQFVDIIDHTDTRTYRVGVERPPSHRIHRLPIPFQVIERCIDSGKDDELLQELDVQLDKEFGD